MDRHLDSLYHPNIFALGNTLNHAPFVIPAKAGIQWFTQSISATRKWQFNALGDVNWNKLECLQTPRQRLFWIPAFACLRQAGPGFAVERRLGEKSGGLLHIV